jgi:hypothetical protein
MKAPLAKSFKDQLAKLADDTAAKDCADQAALSEGHVQMFTWGLCVSSPRLALSSAISAPSDTQTGKTP